MAVTITKKFHNGSVYKEIAKVVFTSPNFTTPAVAGTRSHMPPGGEYMGTWFEAVDYMYREFVNQDYANFPTEMESLFGKMTLSGTFDFTNDNTATFTHTYGLDFDVVGTYQNVLYRDKNTYGLIANSVSGTLGDGVYTANVTFGSTVGSGIANDWLISSASNTVNTSVSGTSIGNTNPIQNCVVNTFVTVTGTNAAATVMTGSVTGTLTGTFYGTGTGSAAVSGSVSGRVVDTTNTIYSDVVGTLNGTLSGPEHGTITGTVSGTVSGGITAPAEVFSFQYTTSSPITSSTTQPRPRRHHGGNSIIFTVTFGEAYNCRLTAWDDNTHTTTTNKILAEEHYRVDAVAFRGNTADTPHAPVLNSTTCLVYPEAFDIPLKGNSKYYGDFDLIFAIDADTYGEYLVFTPRLVNMDASFIAGSYDFVTTLHYQYT